MYDDVRKTFGSICQVCLKIFCPSVFSTKVPYEEKAPQARLIFGLFEESCHLGAPQARLILGNFWEECWEILGRISQEIGVRKTFGKQKVSVHTCCGAAE